MDSFQIRLENKLDTGDDQNKFHKVYVVKVTRPLTIQEKIHNSSIFMDTETFDGGRRY